MSARVGAGSTQSATLRATPGISACFAKRSATHRKTHKRLRAQGVREFDIEWGGRRRVQCRGAGLSGLRLRAEGVRARVRQERVRARAQSVHATGKLHGTPHSTVCATLKNRY